MLESWYLSPLLWKYKKILIYKLDMRYQADVSSISSVSPVNRKLCFWILFLILLNNTLSLLFLNKCFAIEFIKVECEFGEIPLISSVVWYSESQSNRNLLDYWGLLNSTAFMFTYLTILVLHISDVFNRQFLYLLLWLVCISYFDYIFKLPLYVYTCIYI